MKCDYVTKILNRKYLHLRMYIIINNNDRILVLPILVRNVYFVQFRCGSSLVATVLSLLLVYYSESCIRKLCHCSHTAGAHAQGTSRRRGEIIPYTPQTEILQSFTTCCSVYFLISAPRL